MRKMIFALSLAALVAPLTVAEAQPSRRTARAVQQEKRECRRELRRAENRREFDRERRECQRELERARRSGKWDSWERRWRR